MTIKYVSLKPAVFGAKAPSSFSSEARSVRAENVAFQLEGVTLSQSSDALKITDEDSFIEYQLSEPSLFLREFAVQGYILPERFIGYLAQFEWSRKLDPGQQLALYYNILGQVKRMQVDVNPQQ